MFHSKPKPLQVREDWLQLQLSCPRWGLLKRNSLYHSLLVEPSRFIPPVAQRLPLSWDCLQNQSPLTWSFQLKTLISWKVIGSLIVAQDLVHPICLDKHVFCADPAVKTIVLSEWACWSSHKEAAQFIQLPHFVHPVGPIRKDTSSWFAPFCFIVACNNGFKCMKHSTWRTLLHAFNTTEDVI